VHRGEHTCAYPFCRFPCEEVQIEGDLIVAAAARVKL
jgi:hypothetical protein